MAANVETMFYSGREVPWHGLGVQVIEAPTSKDAIRLAGLDWKVEKKPIYDAFGKQIDGYYANTRNSDGNILGVVGNRYQIVQNEEAFAFTDNLIGDEVHYETAGSLKSGKQIWLLAKMDSTKILDDAVDPYICFTNTFDGTGAVKVCMTPIRVVCNNTLNVALNTAKRTWSARHTGDMATKLQEAKETLGLAKKYMAELSLEAEKLAEQKVTDSDLERILDEMYPVDLTKDSHRKIQNAIIMKDAFFDAYNMSDISKFKGTAWGAINAMSDMVGHTAPNRMTTNYQENNWGKIITGHPSFDRMYELLAA